MKVSDAYFIQPTVQTRKKKKVIELFFVELHKGPN